MKTASVFGAITILSVIFLKIDIIMLSKIRDTVSVAIYIAAAKIMDALFIIPLAFVFIYLPVLAWEFQTNNKQSASQLLHKITRSLFLIVIPLGLGVAYFAESIVLTMYGEQYIGSTVVLQILMVTFLVLSTDMILGMLCKSSGFQKMDLLVLIVNTVSNILLNLVLIPPLGYIGASIATVVSICISLVLHYSFVTRNIIQLTWLKFFGKPFLAAILALLVLHPLSNILHFATHLILFAIGYGFFLFLTKGISVIEVKSLFKSFELFRVKADS
jgi:O-antigen/teichoic acid export membrane protein